MPWLEVEQLSTSPSQRTLSTSPYERALSTSPYERALSTSPSERVCERSSFSFYRSVRDHEAVWLLEDMRCMEVFTWEDGAPRAFPPSDALLYSLVHDHQDYARYLLRRYGVTALAAPPCRFCCCAGASLLTVAVRYDRVSILGLMLDALKETQRPDRQTDRQTDRETDRSDVLQSCGGCVHVADAGKTAVRVAVELSRADCLLLLLAHGARPDALDDALQRVVAADASERRAAQRCLYLLLLFRSPSPDPALALTLGAEPQRWQRILGDEVFRWLLGAAPPPLLLQAMRCLAQSEPQQIHALPEFLQPHSWQ